jgi:hypothetical protein
VAELDHLKNLNGFGRQSGHFFQTVFLSVFSLGCEA